MSLVKSLASNYPRGINFVGEIDFYYPLPNKVSDWALKKSAPVPLHEKSPATAPTPKPLPPPPSPPSDHNPDDTYISSGASGPDYESSDPDIQSNGIWKNRKSWNIKVTFIKNIAFFSI